MSRRRDLLPAPAAEQWHAAPVLLAAYAGGRTGPLDSWSLEMHLVSCAMCRAELALVLDANDRVTLDQARSLVLAGVPTALRPAVHTARRWPPACAAASTGLTAHARLVLQPAALASVVLAVLCAVGLDVLARVDGQPGRGGLLWLLAPALPLAGVALCSVRDADPWREAVLATPSAGLRLTLWRTAAVLVVAVPGSVGVGLTMGGPRPVLWLLPCLALTVLTLALGTAIALERSAALLGASWCALVLTPALVDSSSGSLEAVRSLAVSPTSFPALGAGEAQAVWGAVLVAAALVLVHRRTSYGQLRSTSRTRSAL